MRDTDRFLVAIVAAVALLVVVAFAVALRRPPPSYQPGDTPEGLTHNYLLALQRQEYDRAYPALSPTLAGYPPTLSDFVAEVLATPWLFAKDEGSAATVVVASSRITGDLAVVTVQQTVSSQGGLFGSGQRTDTFTVTLRQEVDGWRIYGAERYWRPCWAETEGCN